MLESIVPSLRRLQLEFDRGARETGDLDYVRAQFALDACTCADQNLDNEILEGIGAGIVHVASKLSDRGVICQTDIWAPDPDEGWAGTYWYIGRSGDQGNPMELFDELSQSLLRLIAASPATPAWTSDEPYFADVHNAGLSWTSMLRKLAESGELPAIFYEGGQVYVNLMSYPPGVRNGSMSFGSPYSSYLLTFKNPSDKVIERFTKIAASKSHCLFLRPRCFRASVYAIDVLVSYIEKGKSITAGQMQIEVEKSVSRRDQGEDFKPADWFTRNTKIPAPRLRQAAKVDRKGRTVRAKMIDGIKCYSVADARRHWPDDMEN